MIGHSTVDENISKIIIIDDTQNKAVTPNKISIEIEKNKFARKKISGYKLITVQIFKEQAKKPGKSLAKLTYLNTLIVAGTYCWNDHDSKLSHGDNQKIYHLIISKLFGKLLAETSINNRGSGALNLRQSNTR